VSRPLAWEVFHRLPDSPLPAHLCNVIRVLLGLADAETASGYSGHELIARHLKCSTRHVRGLFAELEQNRDTVTVQRRRRARPDGRGRSSDAWQLVLLEPSTGNRLPLEAADAPSPGAAFNNRQPSSACSTGTAVPIEADQPELQCDQPELQQLPTGTPIPGISLGRSDDRGEGAARRSAAPTSRPRSRRCPREWQPDGALRALALELGLDFELEIEKFRDHEFKTPKGDWDAAARNWLRKGIGGSDGLLAARPRPLAVVAPAHSLFVPKPVSKGEVDPEEIGSFSRRLAQGAV
jgi:hypothetical protein